MKTLTIGPFKKPKVELIVNNAEPKLTKAIVPVVIILS